MNRVFPHLHIGPRNFLNGQKMKYRLWMGVLASACVSLSAHADLMNISSTSLQSTTDEAIACTIIATGGVTYQGFKVLVAYSEGGAADSNPTMRVSSLTTNLVYANDNWQGIQTLNGQTVNNGSDLTSLYTATLGRTPKQTNDSAALVMFAPGDSVCAFSKEVSSAAVKKVSVSLTDITSKVVSTKSLTTQESFLLPKWLPTNAN